MKKISERANELHTAMRHGGECQNSHAYVACLVVALDEWQASVENRLGSIGLGFVPGTPAETVLASGKVSGNSGTLAAMLSRYSPDPSEPEQP